MIRNGVGSLDGARDAARRGRRRAADRTTTAGLRRRVGGDGGGGEPIKIGASLPLTGEFSEPGKAAQQGYQVWEAMTNERAGCSARQVKFTFRDDASDQNTVVSDYTSLISRDKVDLLRGTFSSLLNIPASTVAERNRMLYVEPAGGAPEIFDRGYKHLFFAQQATSDKQGDVWADWVLEPAGGPAARRRPPIRRSTTRSRIPVLEGIREKFEAAGIKTVQQSTYPADTSNFDSIANAVKAKNPDVGRPRRDVRRRRRLRARAEEGRLQAEDALRDERAVVRRPVHQGRRQGRAPRASSTPSATRPRPRRPATRSSSPSTRRCSAAARSPRTRPTRSPRPRSCTAAVNAVGSVERGDQTKLADWLHDNEVDTILGPLSWDEAGRPAGRVPRRPVAGRQAGDRPAGVRRHDRHDRQRYGG